jgi:regulator of sigma E protease
MLDEEDPAGTVYYSLPQATVQAAGDIGYVFGTIVMLPRMLAQGEVEPADVQPTSIVGINEILTISLQQSLETGRAWYTLQTAAMISVALGLTNLLPLPALDGGRILFILIEAIRGRRIRPEIEAAIHFAGMIILLALVMFIMLQDIFNPVIPWSFLDQ